MYQVIIVVHILLGLGIIGLVLMQQGKGADAGATFGGGASGSVFGAQGAASFLSRTTAILATLFFLTSLSLAWLNSNTKSANSDIMTPQDSDKTVEEVKLPDATGAKTLENTPSTAPLTEMKSPETQAPAAPATTTPPNVQPEIKPAEQQTPVEETKPANEPKKDVVEEKKTEVVEEKPKSEHHEKKSSKHKSHTKNK